MHFVIAIVVLLFFLALHSYLFLLQYRVYRAARDKRRAEIERRARMKIARASRTRTRT